jgi:hypothetical protein
VSERSRAGSFVLAFLTLSGFAAGQSTTPDDPPVATSCGQNRPMPPLPATAEQVAEEIGVLPLVQRLRALAACGPATGGISVEELLLRQQITDTVLAALLDVDEVIGNIAFEQAQITEVQDRLTAGKNKKISTLTLESIIVGSGSSAIGNAMGLKAATATAGLWVQVVGGAGGIVLSILALRVQGAKGNLGVAPNMLAPLLGRESEISSVYPQDVWTYLNTVPATNPRVKTPWKEELIAQWVQAGRIGPPTAPASQPKIDRLTSGIANQQRLSIDDLADRRAMLSDVRSRVSLMHRELRDLTEAISFRQGVADSPGGVLRP